VLKKLTVEIAGSPTSLQGTEKAGAAFRFPLRRFAAVGRDAEQAIATASE